MQVGNEDRRFIRTRTNLKKAMLELLKKKDFAEISITEIAKVAHCNRVTFYSHYKSHSDLLADIFQDYLTELVQYYRESFKGKKSFSLADPSRNIPIFEFVYQNQFVFSLMLMGEVIPGSQNIFCESMSTISRNDLKLKEDALFDTEAFNSYYTYAFLGLMIYWIKENFKSSPEEMADRISSLHQTTLGEVIVKSEE